MKKMEIEINSFLVSFILSKTNYLIVLNLQSFKDLKFVARIIILANIPHYE